MFHLLALPFILVGFLISGAMAAVGVALFSVFLIPLILLAVLWEFVARMDWVRPVFLPPLTVVIAQFVPLAEGGELIEPLAISLYRTAAGLALAGVPERESRRFPAGLDFRDVDRYRASRLVQRDRWKGEDRG